MKILFWGTRGSLPYAVTSKIIKEKIRSALKIAQDKKLHSENELDQFIENELPFNIRGGYGCSTSCVEIIGGSEIVICDAGTGLRDLGNVLMESSSDGKSPATINIFLSHLHWDHIQGFPFFTPAYVPGIVINIHGFHNDLEDSFFRQQDHPFFPVSLKSMQADINFITLDPENDFSCAGFRIKGIKQNHPGDSYGYSFEKNHKKIVYSTDNEHTKDAEQKDYPFVNFCENADVLILDAQYSMIDAISTKENWGHSSNILVTELSVRSNVKKLIMFHHEPICNDTDLEAFLNNTKEYLHIYDASSDLDIEMAYDGMEINL